MKRFASLWTSALLLTAAAVFISAAPAVKNAIPAIIKALAVSPSDGIFEIDQPGANATDDATAGDDWQTLVVSPPGGAKAFTGIIDDFCGGSGCDDVFTGGSKDEQDIFEWTIDPTFNAPDKNEIVNAYAAQYLRPSDNHLILVFGMERLDASGDAEIGFWFLQGVSYDNTTGTFTSLTGGQPQHVDGDTLVLSHFSNGGGISTIQVYEWVGTGGDSDCGPGVTASSVNCLSPGPDALATVNTANIQVFWPTADKSAGECLTPPCTVKTGNFFEGAIDLTGILGTNECFTTFLAESRSSTSITAELKDVVGGEFDTCKITVDKTATPDAVCKDCAGEPGKTNYHYKVCNEGVQTLTNVTLVDDNGTPGNTGDDFNVNGTFTLLAGECKEFDVLNHVLPDLGPAPYVVTNTVTATGQGGSATVTGTDTADVAVVDCSIDVTKQCDGATPHAGELLHFKGTVTNTGDAELTGVTVTDDHAGLVFGPATLAAGQSANYSGSYTAVLPASPPCESTDTVTATGTVTETGCVVSDTASATCQIATSPAVLADVSCTNVAKPGDKTTISGTIKNTGDVKLVGVTGTVKINNGAPIPVTLDKTTLNPGETANISPALETVPPLDSDCAFDVSLQANATPDPNCGGVQTGSVTNTDTTSCTITIHPALNSTVECTDIGAPGGSTSITGTVVNTGDVPLNNVAATIKINGGAPQAVTLDKTSLAVGETANISPPFQASPGGACSFTVSIQASATANPSCGTGTITDPTPGGDTCSIGSAPSINTSVLCTDVSAPGGTTSVTGTVTNNGNVQLTGVTAQVNGNAVTLSQTTLDPGASATISPPFVFVPPLDADCSFDVTLTAQGTPNPDCGTGAISDQTPDTHTCTIGTDPKLDTSVLCTDVSAPGGQTTVTGTVTNTGNVKLINLTATVNGNAVSLDKTTLNPGEVANISPAFQFAPSLDADCQFDVTLQAHAKPDPDCGSPTDVSDPSPAQHTCTIDTNPSIDVSVSCTDSTGAGNPIVISGTVTNNGNVPLTGVSVDITVTANGTVLSAVSGANLAAGASQNFTVNYTGLAAGTCSTFTASAKGTADPDCEGLGVGGVTDQRTTALECCVPGTFEACTPGYWKNHEFAWDGITGNPDPHDSAAGAGFEFDTLFFKWSDTAHTVLNPNGAGFFNLAPGDIDPAFQVFYPLTLTMDQALALGGGNPMKMTRHTIAALLNIGAGLDYQIPSSCTLTGSGPCIDAAGIKKEFEARIIAKIYSPFASDLAKINQVDNCPCDVLGCPP